MTGEPSRFGLMSTSSDRAISAVPILKLPVLLNLPANTLFGMYATAWTTMLPLPLLGGDTSGQLPALGAWMTQPLCAGTPGFDQVTSIRAPSTWSVSFAGL